MDRVGRGIAMTIVMHHSIAEVDQTEELKWRQVKVRIKAFVLNQKFNAYLCVVDNELYELFVRLRIVVVEMEERLEEVNEGSVVLNAAKSPCKQCLRTMMSREDTYCRNMT